MARFMTAVIAGLVLFAAPVGAQQPSAERDGLAKVYAKRFDAAYAAPGANFPAYRKVMIDPAEAVFRKNWQRDQNTTRKGHGERITDEDAARILKEVQTELLDAFAEGWRAAGYEVVTAPGPDVLRLKPAIVDLDVFAPDKQTSANTLTFSEQAGRGTFVLEARDSTSGALLLRAEDKRYIGDDNVITRRTSVDNRTDFRIVSKRWSKMSADLLGELKAGRRAAGS